MLSLLLCILISAPAQAKDGGIELPDADSDAEAWLVTYGPGDIYWQRFGHNAIWIREPALGIDHAFNFGFFDFNQENFLLNFIQGRMSYFAAAQPAEDEFRQYIAEGRQVGVQKLKLAPDRFVLLRNHLLESVRPESRDYLYDYYDANCSTKVRDALDLAVGGALAEYYRALPATQNFRDHTRRSTAMDFWYYLGLETGLALPVDRRISAWDEMFLPAKVSEAVAQFNTPQGPLAEPELILYRSNNEPPSAQPPSTWWRYLLAGLGLMLFFILLSKMAGPVMADGCALAWLVITASAGAVILYLWFGTDHDVAGPNVNILLLNPLFLMGLVTRWRRSTAWLVCGGLILAAAQWILPVDQYNLDVVSFLAPLHLACAWCLTGRSRELKTWFSHSLTVGPARFS